MGGVMDRLRATLKLHGFQAASELLHAYDVDARAALAAWAAYPDCMARFPVTLKRTPQEVFDGKAA